MGTLAPVEIERRSSCVQVRSRGATTLTWRQLRSSPFFCILYFRSEAGKADMVARLSKKQRKERGSERTSLS